MTHIQFLETSQHGTQLRAALRGLEDGGVRLQQVLATMTTMIDGDGSDPAQFSEVVNRYGFGGNADAKAAWDELNSLNSKLTTDAQVTNVHAALMQAFNKFR